MIATDDAEQRARPEAFEFDQAGARQRERFIGAVVEGLDQEQHQRCVDVGNAIAIGDDRIGDFQVFRVLDERFVFFRRMVVVRQQQRVLHALRFDGQVALDPFEAIMCSFS